MQPRSRFLDVVRGFDTLRLLCRQPGAAAAAAAAVAHVIGLVFNRPALLTAL